MMGISIKSHNVCIIRLLFAKFKVFVESFHFLRTTDTEGGTLVDGIDLHVQDGPTGNTIGRLPTGLLYQHTKGCSLKGQTELGGAALRGGVTEHALSLGELLVHVGDETTGIPEGVTVLHIVIDEFLVSRDVLGGTEIGGGEDLAVRIDLDVVPGADPGMPGTVGELTSLGGAPVREFVRTVVEGDQHGGSGPVQRN